MCWGEWRRMCSAHAEPILQISIIWIWLAGVYIVEIIFALTAFFVYSVFQCLKWRGCHFLWMEQIIKKKMFWLCVFLLELGPKWQNKIPLTKCSLCGFVRKWMALKEETISIDLCILYLLNKGSQKNLWCVWKSYFVH